MDEEALTRISDELAGIGKQLALIGEQLQIANKQNLRSVQGTKYGSDVPAPNLEDFPPAGDGDQTLTIERVNGRAET